MPTCKTCVFWREYHYMHKPAFRACDVQGTERAMQADTLLEVDVTVSDDSGLDVHMRTGPEFGCVLHKEA